MMNIFNIFDGFIENYPSLDINEDKEKYTIEVIVPGVKKEDVSIEVENNVLMIEFKNRSSIQERRKFYLPSDVNLTAITAKLENGILEIQLQKKNLLFPYSTAQESLPCSNTALIT